MYEISRVFRASAAQYDTKNMEIKEENGFKYAELPDGTVMITGVKYASRQELFHTELVIPETIDGKSVTVIGASAFAGFGTPYNGWDTPLEMIVIPDSVEVICDQAFDGCRTTALLKLIADN